MDIALGVHVFTSDGKDAGTIDQLILDPATNRVKSAVVHKGHVLTRDVEIPLDTLQIDDAGTVRLALSAHQLDELPQFYEEEYMTPPSTYISPVPYPSDSLFLPLGFAQAPLPPITTTGTTTEPADTAARAAFFKRDLANAVVGEESTVVSSDGEQVGHVHSLLFDPDTGTLDSIVVRHGFLFTSDQTLSAALIDSVDDGVIYLKIDAANARQ